MEGGTQPGEGGAKEGSSKGKEWTGEQSGQGQKKMPPQERVARDAPDGVS